MHIVPESLLSFLSKYSSTVSNVKNIIRGLQVHTKSKFLNIEFY